MVRRGDSAPRAGIQLARKKQILIFSSREGIHHIVEKGNYYPL
jgi:hypothetical protein